MKEMFETALLLASAIITIISKTLESAVCSVITCGQVVIVATPAPWATPTSNGPSSPTTTAAASASPIGPGELLLIFELLKITVVAGFFAGVLFMGNRIITAALPSPPSPPLPLPLELVLPLPLLPPPSPRLELLLPLPPSPPLSPVLSLVIFPAVAFSPLLAALPSPPASPVSSSNSNNNSNSTAAATTFAFALDTTTTTTNIPEAVTSTAVEPPITGEAALVTVSEEKKKKPRHRAGKKRGASAKEKYARDMFEQLPTLGLEEDGGMEEIEEEGQAEGQEEE